MRHCQFREAVQSLIFSPDSLTSVILHILLVTPPTMIQAVCIGELQKGCTSSQMQHVGGIAGEVTKALSGKFAEAIQAKPGQGPQTAYADSITTL